MNRGSVDRWERQLIAYEWGSQNKRMPEGCRRSRYRGSYRTRDVGVNVPTDWKDRVRHVDIGRALLMNADKAIRILILFEDGLAWTRRWIRLVSFYKR